LCWHPASRKKQVRAKQAMILRNIPTSKMQRMI
jgi:hypothetical protein